jgi:hypothetical protein
VATIAMESVSQNIQVPPASEMVGSRRASIRRAAPVIHAAMGGKQYSPASSDAVTLAVNGSRLLRGP